MVYFVLSLRNNFFPSVRIEFPQNRFLFTLVQYNNTIISKQEPFKFET